MANPLLGPPLLITMEMVVKSICKMQSGKASGPPGVVTEMLKASSDLYIELIAYLTNSVVRENTLLSEWDVSFIFTDAIFILRQVQEKNIGMSFTLYFAFVDLEKAFNKVLRKVLWWALWELGILEWTVQIMYQNARSCVRINNSYSDVFKVQVGIRQGSALSPLLLIVLVALS